MSRGWTLVVLAMAAQALAGCAREGPKMVVQLGLSTADAKSLLRVRLVVRECENDLLALGVDVPLGEDRPDRPDRLDFDAALEPGQAFYVSAQGWAECSPATMACVQPDDDDALPGDCICLDELEPPKQRLTRHACSAWLRAPEEEVQLRLTALTDSCPPADLESCEQPLQ